MSLLHLHWPRPRAVFPGYHLESCRCGALRWVRVNRWGNADWATGWSRSLDAVTDEMHQHTRDSGIGPAPTRRQIVWWYVRFCAVWFGAYAVAVWAGHR